MLKAIPADAPVEDILGLLAEDGVVVVSNLIVGNVLSLLQNDLNHAAHKHRPGTLNDDLSMQRFWDSNTKCFVWNLFRFPSFINALANSVMEAVSDTLRLPYAKDWWLNSAQMMAIRPGEKAQFVHRDVNNWPHFVQPQAPDFTTCTIGEWRFGLHVSHIVRWLNSKAMKLRWVVYGRSITKTFLLTSDFKY